MRNSILLAFRAVLRVIVNASVFEGIIDVFVLTDGLNDKISQNDFTIGLESHCPKLFVCLAEMPFSILKNLPPTQGLKDF